VLSEGHFYEYVPFDWVSVLCLYVHIWLFVNLFTTYYEIVLIIDATFCECYCAVCFDMWSPCLKPLTDHINVILGGEILIRIRIISPVWLEG
jgi:hypothetical protein